MRDITLYVRMLLFIEQTGGPVALRGRRNQHPVDFGTVHVLKAGAFLHLYNVVEFTVSAALKRIATEIEEGTVSFHELEDCWRRAWVGSAGKMTENLSAENAVKNALLLCESVANRSVIKVKPRLNVGNLDDRRIADVAKTHGIDINLSERVQKAVKYQVKNDLGFLGVIRDIRNDLAHGEVSFADIGRNYTTADIRLWSAGTYRYLKEVLDCFEVYLKSQKFKRLPPIPPPPTPRKRRKRAESRSESKH